MTSMVPQRWVDKGDPTVWAELAAGENPRKSRSVLAKFFHKNGEFLRRCYVTSKYILSEFSRQQ